jgi:hypothetical protein
MRFLHPLLLLLGLASTQVLAWGNHTLVSYRAFEKMPEVASASTVTVEPLEAFLRAEENTLEALLASQEAWALASLEAYPARPAVLAFQADPARSDAERRRAFLMALRVAPDSRFALYFHPDPWNPVNGTSLAQNVVSTLVEPFNQGQKFLALQPGEQASALAVLASASDEPEYGLDAYLWDDSPSAWGKQYGFGNQPFGNPTLATMSQAPFQRAFLHESRLVYLSAPKIKSSFVLLRFQQYATLAALAFRTGHAYWGWRFAGLSLHYAQDLAHPYHASLAPGQSAARLLGTNTLAMAGLPGLSTNLQALVTSQHLALEKHHSNILLRGAATKLEGALEKALRNTDKDKGYPDWSERYLRDVVSLQASNAAAPLAQALVAALIRSDGPDPERVKPDGPERAALDTALADLQTNLGAHSRNALRGILRVADPP